MSDVNFTPTRGAYKELTPFRYWCQKVLPLVYDDSISYYELLCKVVNYLNITMEDVSTLNDDVTAMYTAYNELQDFVNQYFTDLNIQTQIDNKLDRMAADGSLNALIDPLVIDTTETSVANTLPGVVEDQLPDIVEDQIDDVVGEQIDGVVADQIQGAANNWLSANITGSNALDSTLKLYDAAARSFSAGNLIDTYASYLGAENRITTFASGFWENDNGVMVHPSESNLFYQSAAITVTAGDKYTIIAPAFTDVYNGVPRYAFTDNSYNVISASDAAAQGAINKTITVPAGATKLIVNDNMVEYTTDARISKMILVKGELTGTNEISNLKADLNQITEFTRNLNTAQMGRYGNAEDGKIYPRSNNYYGMASFIPVIATEKYTISYNDILSTNDLSITILYLNNNDEVVSRSGYNATNPRVITVPENAVKMNLHFYSTSEVSVSSSSYVQIERGEVKTQYIKPVSAIDDVLREEIKQTPIKYMSAIGAMLDIALGYLNVSYNNDLVDLAHESGKGLFFTDIKNDNDKFAIQCSEFATALYKGVAWDQSRYCVSQNSIAKWGYTTDGTEQTEQDGVPYALSYYDYINNPSLHQTSDIVSKDYMIASEMFRYALNHGWGYEITDIRKQVRPGDFVFYVDSHDIPEKVGKYKGITHVALAIDVGYDNNKLTILESNNYYLPSKDDDVGIGIGVVNITDYKYGARIPVNESESEYTILADNSLNITGEVTEWSSIPIYSDIIQEAGNIYTVELNCELENLNYLKIGVRYNDGIKWNVPMINGNVASIVFYANEDFQYVYAGIYNNQTYTLKKMSLYKGYAPR